MGVVGWALVAVVVVGVLASAFGWDRYRGRPRGSGGGSGAQSTDEIFIDPANGQRMRVWYDPATGRREYRPE